MALQILVYKGVDVELWALEFISFETSHTLTHGLSSTAFAVLTPKDSGCYDSKVRLGAAGVGTQVIDKEATTSCKVEVFVISPDAPRIG